MFWIYPLDSVGPDSSRGIRPSAKRKSPFVDPSASLSLLRDTLHVSRFTFFLTIVSASAKQQELLGVPRFLRQISRR